MILRRNDGKIQIFDTMYVFLINLIKYDFI